MGGCVSTPKDFAVNEGEAPVEVPTSPKKADGETVARVLFLSFLSFSFNSYTISQNILLQNMLLLI